MQLQLPRFLVVRSIDHSLGGSTKLLYSQLYKPAMHRKKADFDPSGSKNPEPILMKLDMVDYVVDPTPHYNFGGRNSPWVFWAYMRLVNLVSFLSYFFCFLSPRAQVAFLDRSGRAIRQNACFRPMMCLLGVSTISDHIQGSNRQKTPPNWPE